MDKNTKGATVRSRSCLINGQRVEGDWSPTLSFATVLRKHLGLVAIKVGCDNGNCGSCTILIDGEPAPACQETWEAVENRSIVTPEGIPEETRAAYAKLFARSGMACGFCIPGMAVRLYRLLEQNHRPSRSTIQALMSHHLCRCSGYQGWLESIQQLIRPNQTPPQVSLHERQNITQIERFNHSGASEPTVQKLLSGEPFFADDFTEPEMLEGAISLVPQAWGQVRFVDTTKAGHEKGVHSIIIDDDLDGGHHTATEQDTIPSIPRLKVKQVVENENDLLEELEKTQGDEEFDELHLPHVNQAETSALLSEALAFWKEEEAGTEHIDEIDEEDDWSVDEFLIERSHSEYPWLIGRGENIQCCSDTVALVAADEREQAQKTARAIRILLDDADPQFDAEYAYQRGCSTQVVHHKMSRGDVNQVFRDAHSIVSGTWVTSSTDAICLEPPSCLAIPLEAERIRIVTSGVKPYLVQKHVADVLKCSIEQVDVEIKPAGGNFGARDIPFIEGFAALMAVKEERPVKLTLPREETTQMLPKRHSMRIHATLAADERGYFIGLKMNLFADTGGHASHGIEVLQEALVHACGPYRIAAYELEANAVCSNNPSASHILADGIAQVSFALEGAIDMLSKRTTIDGWALRYRNALQPGDRLPNGQFLGNDCGIVKALEAVRDVYYKYGELAGLACSFKGSGMWHSPLKMKEICLSIEVNAEDSFTLLLPCPETGQGVHALLIQVASEVSGFAASSFSVEVSSSSESEGHQALDGRYGAMVEAVKNAALSLKKQAIAEGLEAGQTFQGSHSLRETEEEPAVHPDLPRFLSFGYAAQVVVLEQTTGSIRRVITACDTGLSEDIAGLMTQVEGAIAMGIGFALTETLDVVEGRARRLQPDEFGMIAPQNMPYMKVILLSGSERKDARDCRSAGALAFIPVAPAIASALYKHEGFRYFSLPMSSSPTAMTHHPQKVDFDIESH